jgi:enoyl-CoA hydratase
MTLRVAARDGIVTATLSRPERRNALDHQLFAALDEAFAAFAADRRARVLVVTGEGSAFCSGMDMSAFADNGPVDPPAFFVAPRSKPVIAAVNGPAVAAGLELVLACDLAVASETATFALPEVRRGLVAAYGTWGLARAIGSRPALELALTGEPIDARRAHALGLVGAVVPRGQVLAAAYALAERIVQGAPSAIAATLDLVRRAPDLDAERMWELGLEAAAAAVATAEAAEGASAFIERRAPRWTA